ncbi:related to RFX1 |uniref:Related to RFX1 \|nr:putative protein [Melanopsichium pennsylvanicum 4]SNX84584.1 related to RFX1 \
MSVPYYTGQTSSFDSPYRPGTADNSWEQSRSSSIGDERPELYAHMTAGTTSSLPRPEPLQPTLQSAMGGAQMGVYLGPNAVTPRQSAFPRDQVESETHFGAAGGMDGFDHCGQGVMPTDTPRAAHFSAASTMGMGAQHAFATTHHTVPTNMQQSYDTAAYNRYGYPAQTATSSWSAPEGMSMSQNVIYDTSSSANTSPNRSYTYHDVSGDHYNHSGYTSHMSSHTCPIYGPSTSKLGAASAYVPASQPEYQPEEIDAMLNQVSTLYTTANTKKMAEFYRDKWARMWLTCNYTLKPSIQISIPRTILHESYRRACESFGLEPLQAASFGKVLRSQFPDVAQRRLGGRGKTRFHYCGFGTSNEREAVKVKSLLEDEKAGKLQLSAGLSAEYASEARAKVRSEGREGGSSFGTHAVSEASPVQGSSSRSAQYHDSPHASFENSNMANPGTATDGRLIASAFATLNSSVLTPPGTSSGNSHGSQDASRYSQVRSQGQSYAVQSSNSAMPRRHTVSHSYSGLSDLSFFPGGDHPSSETGDAGMMHSGEVPAFGHGGASGISEPAQSASLMNSPASSLHGYQYVQDPRHTPSSIPFRRSCQDLTDWPVLHDQNSTSFASINYAAASNPSAASQESSRKAWREYESLCQALLYSIYMGPDPVSFQQRTISFWNSPTQATYEALRSDATLQNMVLRADDIIFRQLLIKLDGMIGDDVAEESMPGLKGLVKMLGEQMEDLFKIALPDAFRRIKVQASLKMAESLDKVVKIFDAIKTFREESMLDVGRQSFDADLNTVNAPQPPDGTPSISSPSCHNLALSHALRNTTWSRPGTVSFLSSTPAEPVPYSQLRRRDNSISSNFSDSNKWNSNDANPRASSSASESEVLSNIDGIPNDFVAPLARKAPRSRMASDTSGGISLTFGSLALAMPQHGSPLLGQSADVQQAVSSSEWSRSMERLQG